MMSRKIQDAGLGVWEVFASTGAFGLPERPRIVFHSLTDRAEPARFVEWQGDKSGAERAVRTLAAGELVAMLGRAQLLP